MSPIGYLVILTLAILAYSDIGLFISYARVETHCKKRCIDAPVSIIVSAYNCKDTLDETLLALLSSNLKMFEIIVVDDGSTDSTREVALSYASTIVRVIHQEHQGKGAALNNAVRYCSFTNIVLVDSDTIVTPDAIGYLTDALLSHDAVTANLQVERKMNFLTWLQAQEHLRISMFRRAKGIDTLSGACVAFRKTILEKYPFSSSIVEDYEHTVRIRKVGASLGYVPCAIVYTNMPSSIKGYVNQRLRWAQGTLLEMKRLNISRITLLRGYALALADVILVISSIIAGMWWALVLVFIIEALLQSYAAHREIRSMRYTSILFFPALVLLAIMSLAISMYGIFSASKTTRDDVNG